jgi:hypothetical protein
VLAVAPFTNTFEDCNPFVRSLSSQYYGVVSIVDISKHSIGGVSGRASEYTSGHGVNVLGNPSSRDLIASPAGSEGLR